MNEKQQGRREVGNVAKKSSKRVRWKDSSVGNEKLGPLADRVESILGNLEETAERPRMKGKPEETRHPNIKAKKPNQYGHTV